MILTGLNRGLADSPVRLAQNNASLTELKISASEPALRLQPQHELAPRAGFIETALAAVHDDRAHVLAVGQVVHPHKLAKRPVTTVLLELHTQVEQGVACRHFCVQVIHQHTQIRLIAARRPGGFSTRRAGGIQTGQQALGGGGVCSLRSDPLGKSFAQMLLDMPLRVPASVLTASATGDTP